MKLPLQISLLMGALGVAIGAFGAHALESVLQETGRINTWNTGMQYYWIHTLAMLALASSNKSTSILRQSVFIWLVSIVLFCGSLFALAVGAPSWTGAITPIGGIGFIGGWLLLLRPEK